MKAPIPEPYTHSYCISRSLKKQCYRINLTDTLLTPRRWNSYCCNNLTAIEKYEKITDGLNYYIECLKSKTCPSGRSGRRISKIPIYPVRSIPDTLLYEQFLFLLHRDRIFKPKDMVSAIIINIVYFCFSRK